MASRDVVWEHGENLYPGWRCNYCRTQKGGGGATRLKQHLAGRGAEVVHCRNVPPDVRDFFQRELDRAKKATADRARERLRREKAAAEGNYPGDEEDEEAQVQRAMDLSRAEAEFRRGVEQRGGAYERGGGSGSTRGNVMQRMFRRSTSQRESPVVEDYNLAAGGRRGMTQPRIDTGSWTQKGKNAKEAIGISMQPPTRWVYEWEDPHFYTMLVQEWQTTSAWTGQTWQHYKAELLRVRGIALMSTAEYQTASQMGVFPFLR